MPDRLKVHRCGVDYQGGSTISFKTTPTFLSSLIINKPKIDFTYSCAFFVTHKTLYFRAYLPYIAVGLAERWCISYHPEVIMKLHFFQNLKRKQNKFFVFLSKLLGWW